MIFNRKNIRRKDRGKEMPASLSRSFGGQSVLLGMFWMAFLILAPYRADGVETETFRVGFSSLMFTDVNENDAKAAIKIWGQVVAKERGIPVSPETIILRGREEIQQAIQNAQVDVVGMPITEFGSINGPLRFDRLFVTDSGGKQAEQIVLIVHRDGKIQTFGDLRGRSLSIQNNPRACLAEPWLDTLLAEKGFPPIDGFAGLIVRNSKLQKVLLPVFFKQVDACVTTRTGFETMRELNPQLGIQLKIIAASEEMVPAVFAFRDGYAPSFRESLFASIRELHTTPAGQQVLTIFQSERIEDRPVSSLDSALSLLKRHAGIRRAELKK